MLMEQCTEGTSILELCCLGDDLITEECSKVHNKGKAKVEAKDKGVAFPTCVSVNEVSGHNSVASADESVLAAGDLVKIALAAHIDGWIAAVAHTVVVSEDPAAKIEEGPKRNVVLACAVAAEAVLANLK